MSGNFTPSATSSATWTAPLLQRFMAALNHTKKTVSNSKTFTLTTMINTANVSFCTITTTTMVSFSSLPGSAKFSPSTWTEIFVNNYNVYTEGTGTGSRQMQQNSFHQESRVHWWIKKVGCVKTDQLSVKKRPESTYLPKDWKQLLHFREI